MKLIENECSEALTRLLRPYYVKVDVQNVYHSINKDHSIEDDSNLLTLLIQEYFDNPPLKWEEIKEGDFVFDKDFNMLGGEWLKVYMKRTTENGIKVLLCGACGSGAVQTMSYKEDRFYRKEVVQE